VVIDGIVNGVGRMTSGGAWLSTWIEKHVIYAFLNVIGYGNHLGAAVFRRLQTGYVHHYAVILIVGLFLMVTFFVWWQGGGVEPASAGCGRPGWGRPRRRISLRTRLPGKGDHEGNDNEHQSKSARFHGFHPRPSGTHGVRRADRSSRLPDIRSSPIPVEMPDGKGSVLSAIRP